MRKPLLLVAALVLIPALGIFYLSLRSTGNELKSFEAADAPLLKEALEGEGQVRCEFADERSAATSTAYVSAGKIRVDGPPQNPYHLIFLGAATYIWSDASEGYVYTEAAKQSVLATTSPLYVLREEFGAPLSRRNLVDTLSHGACAGGAIHPNTYLLPTSIDFRDLSLSEAEFAGKGLTRPIATTSPELAH
jgi:hypothetical protein